tara:strand:+ start:320 stop:565 length:246 start_codon:yes stop_codon:yes gene_type:complete
MPFPLSIALMAMNAGKRFHNAATFERPFILRRVYYGRLLTYTCFTAVLLASSQYEMAITQRDGLQKDADVMREMVDMFPCT